MAAADALAAHIAARTAETSANAAHPNPACCKSPKRLAAHLLAILIPCITPFVLLVIALHEDVAVLEKQFLGMYMALIVLLIGVGVAFLEATTEDSISGMVAQRFNKVSYCAILLVVGTAFYTSAFITAGGIVRTRDRKANDNVALVFASISPILSVGILIFPLKVFKSAADLGFVPTAVESRPRDGDHNFPMPFYHCPCCNTDCEGQWKCITWNFNWHTITHFLCIVVGLVSGYATIVVHLNFHDYSRVWTLELIFFLISLISICFFLIAKLLGFVANMHSLHARRFVLYIEFIGLYYYLIDLIYVSVVAGDLILVVN